MKKRWIIMIGFVCVLILGAGFVGYKKYRSLALELNEEKTSYPEIYDMLNSITVDTFVEKMDAEEDFIVYIGRPTCPDCSSFEPQFIELLEETGVASKICYLNVAQISKDKGKWENFKKKFGFEYVPTIAKIQDGEIIEKVGWTPENGINIEEIKNYLVGLST